MHLSILKETDKEPSSKIGKELYTLKNKGFGASKNTFFFIAHKCYPQRFFRDMKKP
jgi:hypothetical protein